MLLEASSLPQGWLSSAKWCWVGAREGCIRKLLTFLHPRQNVRIAGSTSLILVEGLDCKQGTGAAASQQLVSERNRDLPLLALVDFDQNGAADVGVGKQVPQGICLAQSCLEGPEINKRCHLNPVKISRALWWVGCEVLGFSSGTMSVVAVYVVTKDISGLLIK